MLSTPSLSISDSASEPRNSIWILGIPAFVFGLVDRSFSILADNYVSFAEFLHVAMIVLLFAIWLCLKPEAETAGVKSNSSRQLLKTTGSLKDGKYLSATQTRMAELQDYHMISQSYTLPFPYWCQIYHLLNLKHLETVHHFSLSNLKVTGVSNCHPTSLGGKVKFNTILSSSINVLQMWRKPVVEVDLTLHTPHTVELSIPIHAGKRMIVMFNSFPIDENTHELLIDIYTDLKWPKPILQMVLHIAAMLTLYEDLPYLKKISENSFSRLLNPKRLSRHDSMWLFGRFVELYAHEVEKIQAAFMPDPFVQA